MARDHVVTLSFLAVANRGGPPPPLPLANECFTVFDTSVNLY